MFRLRPYALLRVPRLDTRQLSCYGLFTTEETYPECEDANPAPNASRTRSSLQGRPNPHRRSFRERPNVHRRLSKRAEGQLHRHGGRSRCANVRVAQDPVARGARDLRQGRSQLARRLPHVPSESGGDARSPRQRHHRTARLSNPRDLFPATR